MLFGIVVGTSSSIGIAAPILLFLGEHRLRRDSAQIAPPAGSATAAAVSPPAKPAPMPAKVAPAKGGAAKATTAPRR
jgi:preprotein translocase subunit SecD/preprotein translocase subunit SecF